MYQFISGILAEKSPTHVVIDVSGIGYELLIPLSTHHDLPKVGQQVKLLTHFVVREDSQQLFGFKTPEERELFRYLISVSGIGPKLGLTTLSGLGIQELRQAIVDGAVPILSTISGIGRKTAERIVIELREKIIVDDTHVVSSKRADVSYALIQDAVQALVALGYKKNSAKEAIQKVLVINENNSKIKLEDIIRQSLKYV